MEAVLSLRGDTLETVTVASPTSAGGTRWLYRALDDNTVRSQRLGSEVGATWRRCGEPAIFFVARPLTSQERTPGRPSWRTSHLLTNTGVRMTVLHPDGARESGVPVEFLASLEAAGFRCALPPVRLAHEVRISCGRSGEFASGLDLWGAFRGTDVLVVERMNLNGATVPQQDMQGLIEHVLLAYDRSLKSLGRRRGGG